MSYTFSSPNLPPGFSIVAGQLMALANAPAFAGNITIALTDGVSTVNKVIAIDRRPTTVSALVTQTVDLISIAGATDALVTFEIVTQSMISEAGSNDSVSSFTLVVSQLISIAGATDEFTLGASVLADNITANGVAFAYRFKDFGSASVATFGEAFYISVYRPYEDSPETSEAAIGCYVDSAAGFRANLLSAVRTKFNTPTMQENSCDTRTFAAGGPVMIEYVYVK